MTQKEAFAECDDSENFEVKGDHCAQRERLVKVKCNCSSLPTIGLQINSAFNDAPGRVDRKKPSENQMGSCWQARPTVQRGISVDEELAY
jgi:hypothetical protein